MIEDKPNSNSIISSKEYFSDTKTKDNKASSICEYLFVFILQIFSSIKKLLFPILPYKSQAQNLFNINAEFKLTSILFISWIILTTFEFFYALIKSESHIMSDAFFNSFKTISFFMTCISILISHIHSSNKNCIYKRIELISALSSTIFLVIVSVHMILQSLHIITEEHEHLVPIKFTKFFYIFKSIINIISLMILSDYILHPSIQIRLSLWKICKTWNKLDEYSFDQIKKCKMQIKQWNNHFENMNALCTCLISDILTSVMFIFYFSFGKQKYYSKMHLMISFFNFLIVFFLSKPLLNSVINILMQGKSLIYEPVLNKIEKEITYYEGCLGIKERKYWMTSQNEIKSYFKIYAQRGINKNKLKDSLHKICEEVQLNCDFTIEITE